MNKCTKSWLRSGLSMLLALCLVFSAPIVALADTGDYCNVAEAEAAVDTAAKYGPLSEKIADLMITNFFEKETYNKYFVKSLTSEVWKEAIIEEIVAVLDEEDKEAMLVEYGIEPTTENKTMLANAIYDIAVVYHDNTANHTENLEAGLRIALVDTMEFALTEVEGMTNVDAELYYNLYLTNTNSGRDAAVEMALEAIGEAHDYVDGVCSVCGAEDPNYVPPTEHVHNYVKGATVPATCTEDGYTVYTCECGDTYNDDYVDATGHDFVDGTCADCGEADPDYVAPTEHTHNYVKAETVPATCTEDGYTVYACECGDSYEVVIEAAGHDYVDGTCANCGEADPDYVAPTEPEETEPEATEPEATEPEATEPEATEPEATEPEATEPEATEPEATEPTEPEQKPSASDKLKDVLKKLFGKWWGGNTEPEEPEATEPEATEPEATEPEATEPEEPSVPNYSGIIDTIRKTIKDLFGWLKK